MFHRLLSILRPPGSSKRPSRRRNKRALQRGLWQIQALEPRVLLSASIDGRH